MHVLTGMASVEIVVVEGVCLASLMISGLGFLLFEVWGIAKIWKLIRKRSP